MVLKGPAWNTLNNIKVQTKPEMGKSEEKKTVFRNCIHTVSSETLLIFFKFLFKKVILSVIVILL